MKNLAYLTNTFNSVNSGRRHFLKSVSIAGAGFAVGVFYPRLAVAQSATEGAVKPSAFIRIGVDNIVTVVMKHLEMGQGTYTGLATLVAEELDADWDQIESVGAPADAKLYNNLLWGPMQGTGGSTAMANSFMQMRQVGAAMRAMLVAAAAKQWGISPEQILVNRGLVSHTASQRQATFGELAEAAAQQSPPPLELIKLKSPQDFIYIGKNVSRKDTGKTDGSALYTQDFKTAGLLTAVVAHPPLFGATVRAVNADAAKAVPGVEDVVSIASGVAVLAKDFWTAKKGRDKLLIDWDETEAVKISSGQLMTEYKKMAQEPGMLAVNVGNAGSAMPTAKTVLEAEYEFPFLAHAAMEPLNCAALVTDNACEIWNGGQMQTGDQYSVAALLNIPPENVKINTLYAGGSFGRRGNPKSDYVLEAVNIAKAKKGTPIKLVWTREDDMRGGYYRPMYFHKLRAGLDEDGQLIAWEHRIVGQSIASSTSLIKNDIDITSVIKNGIDITSVEGAVNLPYDIPNIRVELHSPKIGVPVLWWRSVGSTHTAYSTETFIDELAAAAGKEPIDFRLQLLSKHPRHRAVLALAANKAGWDKPAVAGRYRGVAVHESFNSVVAQVVEISLTDDKKVRVERVICAVDCGLAVNPDIVRAQMESGIGYGLAAALTGEITLQDGKVVQSNFHDYKVLRINQMPDIEVHIVPSEAAPTGVGEPGTPPIAPALINALYAATQKRHYRLPLRA